MAYDLKQKKKKSDNISEWYNDIVLKAGLAEYGPVRGTMIIKPYGYAIWELVQKAMDLKIKEKGVENAYFPLFIPMALLKKEQAHVEGFSPELAVVTIGGGEELAEPVAVRPTSETIMYEAYKNWVKSWRDLPILVNQWNNCVRWEKRTYLFLRTSEFLWQEGHTAHATHEEAEEMVSWAINMYQDIYNDLYAMPGYIGRKSESEKFAGGDVTFAFESMMPDGKALQSCTSHDLGQNFSKPFNIAFQDKKGDKQYVWQTSWGFSTRSIGGLVLTHGDDKGLKLPPKIAPFQVVILPVNSKDSKHIQKSEEVAAILKKGGVRVKVDSREDETIGFRINKWEERGVPIRIEFGDKEIASGKYTLSRRDTGEKVTSSSSVSDVLNLLAIIQKDMYQNALNLMNDLTSTVKSYEEFKEVMEKKKGFISAFWCESRDCEDKIKAETRATTRCLPADSKEGRGKCIYCGEEASHKWLFAQAY